jgi:pyridoxine 4-dehydrogenase
MSPLLALDFAATADQAEWSLWKRQMLCVRRGRLVLRLLQPRQGLEAPLTALAELKHQGLIRHIGLSNVTPAQIAAGRLIAPIV